MSTSPNAPDDQKTFRILTSAVDTCAQADDVLGAERWMDALQVRSKGPRASPFRNARTHMRSQFFLEKKTG